MKIRFFDLETTGLPHHGPIAIWALGSVLVDTEDDHKIVKGSTFGLKIKVPQGALLSPYAMRLAREQGFDLTNMVDPEDSLYEDFYSEPLAASLI